MVLTEKYEVFIAFLGREVPEEEYIQDIWNQVILEEYQKTSIYINVTIDERLLACVDCSKRESGFIITAIRNPIQAPDQEQYYRAIGNALFKMRKILDSPYTFVVMEEVKVSFFPYDPQTGR